MTWRMISRDSLLILTILILITSGWTIDGHQSEGTDIEVGIPADDEIRHQTNGLDRPNSDPGFDHERLPNLLFGSSADNDSLILNDFSRCLLDFPFVSCMKFLLLSRLDNVIDYVNEFNGTDLTFFNGNIIFKSVPKIPCPGNGRFLGLDEDITQRVLQIFAGRALHVKLFPGISFEMSPVTVNNLIGFEVRPHLTRNSWQTDAGEETGRKRKGGFKMPPLMIMPQLIMFGLMPFALANLQAMVMNAFMLNMMALNSAVFMTIRNLVFGPKDGPKVKYVNYGYKKKKKTGGGVPTVIVHSPAAFVKQPIRKFPKPHKHRHNEAHGDLVILLDEGATSYSETNPGDHHVAIPLGEYQSADHGHKRWIQEGSLHTTRHSPTNVNLNGRLRKPWVRRWPQGDPTGSPTSHATSDQLPGVTGSHAVGPEVNYSRNADWKGWS